MIRVFLFLLICWHLGIVPMQESPPLIKNVLAIPDTKVVGCAFLGPLLCAIAAVNGDLSSTITVANVVSIKSPKKKIPCSGPITSISACDKKKKIAVGVLSAILIYDSETGQQVCEYKAHAHRVNSISAHPVFPAVLVSGSQDKTIKIWDLRNPVASKIENAHDNCVTEVRVAGKISEAQHQFLSCSDDKTTKIWDFKMLKTLHAIKHLEYPLGIEYNAQSDRFMINAKYVTRYNADNGALMATFNRNGIQESLQGSRIGATESLITACASTSKDEQELLAIGRDDGKIALCYPEDARAEPRMLTPFAGPVEVVAFSLNGDYLVASCPQDKLLQVYEVPKKSGQAGAHRRPSLKGCFGLK
ncbi:hypothetical protein BH09DEP1_BH09DEP1_2230 [soil metagenome]